MSNSRKPVLIFVGFALLACFGFLYFAIAINPGIIFLPPDDSAQWICYPKPLQLKSKDNNDQCLFTTTFHVDNIGAGIILHVRALRQFRLWINDREVVDLPAQKNWKKGVHIDIKRLVHPGVNKIRVMVTNNRGPALLWLNSKNSQVALHSDTSWSASLPKGRFRSALVASDTIPHPISYKGAQPLPSLRKTWQWLGLAFLLSVFVFIYHRLVALKKIPQSLWIIDRIAFTPRAVLVLTLIMWLLTLIIHNLKMNPIHYGFDVDGHLHYIVYLLANHSLPLATSGWETYQPPLFYILSAAVLKIYRLFLPFSTRYSLEIIPFLSGAGQVVLAYLIAKLVFEDQPFRQMIVIGMAGLIPMNIFCSLYISNEPLSAFLISLSLYFALKILIERGRFKSSFWFLGIAIGLGLLTKITILILIPVIFLILIYSLTVYHGNSAMQVWRRTGMTAFLAILISGWYYIRNWMEFGTPIVGNWNSASGISWWQDPGFHTASYFMTFGRVFHLPYFASFYSFFDGLYATFWGDSLYGGTTRYMYRTPWNYNFMSSGYLLAFPLTLAMMIGIVYMIREWLKTMDMKWLMLLGYIFMLLFGITYMCLQLPYYAQAKAFYGLGMVLPLSLAAAWGIDVFDRFLKNRSWQVIRAMMWGWLGAFATCVFMSYWAL